MRGQQKQKTTRGLRRDYLPTIKDSVFEGWTFQICDDADRWLGFQFCPYVDRWLLEKNLHRISRNASHAFPFRRWSAPLTITFFLKYRRNGLGSALQWIIAFLKYMRDGLGSAPLTLSWFLCFCLNCVCVVCLYRVPFHGEEPRCSLFCISSKMPYRFV